MKKRETTPKRSVCYAFIDANNLHLGTREQGWTLDWKKFWVYLKDKFRVQKAFYFIGYLKKYEPFYKFLRHVGYELVFKPVVKYGPKKEVKGNVDAELVLHAAKIQYPKYDKAAIVSGDGDFYCLLKELRKESKLLALLIPNRKSQSRLLREFEDYKFFIDRIKERVEKNKKGGVMYST